MNTQIELTDAHHELRKEAREFAERELAPVAEEYEEAGEFPYELVKTIGEAGLHGVAYPEEYGGRGLDWRSFVVAIEELCRGWKLVGGEVSGANTLSAYSLYEYGSEWQKNQWLHGICTGELLSALSMTEPEAGSDAGSMDTTAERDGDEYVINGHKVWTTFGSIADYLTVVARTGGDGPGGLSLIGIPEPTERDGFEVVRDIPCMEGDLAVETEIVYDDLRVPVKNLIGEEGEGFRYIMEGLDLGRIGTAAQAVGMAQAAFEASRSFANEREQFNRPIRKFQGIGFKLADMAMEIEASRMLSYRAADRYDQGLDTTKHAAMAKTYATDMAMDVTTEAVQIHGSRGYSKDYPVERYMRNAKGMQIYEGTNEVNRIVISRELYE
jgi:alkylation response protein AidB-like acyl-CoA dehydrogenase